MVLSQDQISRLSREEKVQLMEALWIDLSRSDEDVESPPWHEECLQETEARYLAGNERVLDWEDAKRELWNRVK